MGCGEQALAQCGWGDKYLRKLVVAGLLLAIGCQPEDPYICTTKCGVQYYGIDLDAGVGSFSCEDVQATEDAILKELQETSIDNRINNPDVSCKALKGLSVHTHDGAAWVDSWNRHVAGLTYCYPGSSLTIIGWTPDMKISDSSLAHEMVHTMQNCDALPNKYPKGYDGHENWYEERIMLAVMYANANLALINK